MSAQPVRIGLLGLGNVGAALIQLIAEQRTDIATLTGIDLSVTRIAVNDLNKSRADLGRAVLTDRAQDVIEADDVDLVVELVGSVELAREWISQALRAHKSVVTGNKALLAAHGRELFDLAAEQGVELLFEASVAGAIPLMRTLQHSLRGEPIDRIMGIVNGTTNYMLSAMTEDGADYAQVLAEAQRLGYAEADPTADVEGHDAQSKAAIIASVAFGVSVTSADVPVQGISNVTAADIANARRLGYVIKLLAVVERSGAEAPYQISARVHPTMVPLGHPLATVRGSFNAIFIEGGAVDELMLYGRGAGGRPTASAVLGDVIEAASGIVHGSVGRLRATCRRNASTPRSRNIGVLPRPRGRRPSRRTRRGRRGIRRQRRVDQVDGTRGARRAGNLGLHHSRRVRSRHCRNDRQARFAAQRDPSRSALPGHRSLMGATAEALGYVSTRGQAPRLTFGDVLLTGLADDGGLYLPESWPQSIATARTDTYLNTAVDVMWPFVAATIDRDAFEAIVAEAYATFETDNVVELVELDPNLWLLELFHGPTLAFKDIALQLVGRLFDHELSRRSERITIVGATSGDTGSAAIEACRDRDAIEIFILHPHGRVSDVQRRQMTTVDSPNVHNIAVEGTFDDCQDLVKAMFADAIFRNEVRLGAVNSINWARVMAQVVYYAVASARLVSRSEPVSFCVPTGNFGNVFAGWAARSMGLAINQFCVATNRNDILARLFNTGTMAIESVVPTLSPSMDIQISSNLERLLFETHGRDGRRIAEAMAQFRETGRLTLDDDHLRLLGELWRSRRVDDDGPGGVVDTTKRAYEARGMLLDPHTAVGVERGPPARSKWFADGVFGDRPSGEVSRRGRARDRCAS